MVELARWNDDRLDDLAQQVQRTADQLERVSAIREELISLRSEVHGAAEDTNDCIRELRALKSDLDRRAVGQAVERKQDRRWLVGTFLTTAALIISALAIFLG